jgi:hypothetical protein
MKLCIQMLSAAIQNLPLRLQWPRRFELDHRKCFLGVKKFWIASQLSFARSHESVIGLKPM